MRNVYIQAIFLNSIYIFSCNYSPLNSPDETVVKVKFMDGKLESSVVLPKGLYHVYFKWKNGATCLWLNKIIIHRQESIMHIPYFKTDLLRD